MIGVIVPFARSWMADNVRANFKRQIQPAPCKLIVVENGPAVGTYEPSLWLDDHVVRSEHARGADGRLHGRSTARTAGLHAARELGCEWYAFLDDDDWWGAGFLEFMWERRDLADLIGFFKHVLEDPTGKRWVMQYAPTAGFRKPSPPHPLNTMVGGIAPSSMFGRLDRALDWTAHVAFSEEIFWMSAMHRAGRTLYGLEDPDMENDPLYVMKRYADPNHGHALASIVGFQREVEGCAPL